MFSTTRSVSLLCILITLLAIPACVQFKEARLYDGMEAPARLVKPEKITTIVEPIIFQDDATDAWGFEPDECQTISLTREVVHSGQTAISLKWNRGAAGCTWAGMGIGWDGYAGKDLAPLLPFAAIQMYVRSHEGQMFGLPIVLTLEDYSGGMGFAYTANRYFERSTIDEEWQKVEVPLSAFDIEKENLNLNNIKQLQLELQQSGRIYLDDIRLVFHEPQPLESWLEEPPLPNPLATPIPIFTDTFLNNNGWGFHKDECQNIRLSQERYSEGQYAIHARWDLESKDCVLTGIGASWHKWNPVDMRENRKSLALQFDLLVVSPQGTELPLRVGLEDYDRVKSGVRLDTTFAPVNSFSSSWTTVRVPIAALPDILDWSRIKHMGILMDDQGEVYIDNIQLVRL